MRDLLDQLVQISAVWKPFLIALAIIAAAIWSAMRWAYAVRIEKLENERDHFKSLSENPTNSVRAERNPERMERQKHLQVLRQAAEDYGRWRADTQGRNAGRVLPHIEAALLTAQSKFGLPIPAFTGTASRDASVGKQYLDLILPFLQQGHDDAAQERAQAFVDQFPKG